MQAAPGLTTRQCLQARRTQSQACRIRPGLAAQSALAERAMPGEPIIEQTGQRRQDLGQHGFERTRQLRALSSIY